MISLANKLFNTRCPLCSQNNNYRVLYQRNFRPEDINIDTFSARRLPDRIHYQFVKCCNDGLVRANPVISSKELSWLYKQSKFTYQQEENNLTDTYLTVLDPVLSSIGLKAKLLEIGCGSGFVLAKLYDLGYRNLYGIEPSISALSHAQGKIRKKIRHTMLKPEIYPASFFDAIFFFQTLDHIADPNSFLRECWRLLRPGGHILSFHHNVASISAKIMREKSPIIDIEHTFLFDQQTSTKLFQHNGFNAIKTRAVSNKVSLRHLLWLVPIPALIKNWLLNLDNKLVKSLLLYSINIKMGNIYLVAQKPD